ncbi:MAG: hypothetical protein ABEJ31_09425 [Haloarculaceae archaeon]
MSDDPSLPPVFDDAAIARAAGRHDVTEADLRALLAAHQAQVRANPGVEDIVYEWRAGFHAQPVVLRTDAAYYLCLRAHVWDEFAEALDLSEEELRAVQSVHEDLVRAKTGAERDDGERFMVLARA